MSRVCFSIIAIILSTVSVNSQEDKKFHKNDLPFVSHINQGNSYITFPVDIGNIESLWFEGNLIPNFYLRKSKNSRLMGVLTPQVIIRMYQEKSFPVRTPSYIPQITLYYLLKEKENFQSLSMYGRAGHHSNGQDGVFLFDDGRINLKSGNFATNFLELGFIKTNINSRFNAYQFVKTSFEFHPEGFDQEELKGIYSKYRWHSTFSIFKLASDRFQDNSGNPTISIKGETTWMFGDYNQLDTFSPERLNLSLTFYYHPKFLEDIGLFVQYYFGSDYYNIYFKHRLNMLRFGLMTEKLRF